MGAALLNIQRVGARGVMRGGWRLVRAPPTSGKSLTETVTLPTYSRPCPVSASFQLCGGPPQVTAFTGVLAVPSPIPWALKSAPAYSVRLNTSFFPKIWWGEAGNQSGAAVSGRGDVKEVSQIPYPLMLHRTPKLW